MKFLSDIYVSAKAQVTDQLLVGTGSFSAYKADVAGVTRSRDGVVVESGQYAAKMYMNSYYFLIEKVGNYGVSNYQFKYDDGSSALYLTGGASVFYDGSYTTLYINKDLSVGYSNYFSFYDFSSQKYNAIGAVKSNNNSDGALIFNYRASQVHYEGMRLTNAGQLKFAKYGVNTFTGTPAYYLAVDASGNVIEATPSGGSGISSLNGLTATTQTFAVGTDGGAVNNINISSTSSTHTFNIPDASATVRGVVTTGTQSFAGNKTFGGTISYTSLLSGTTFTNASSTNTATYTLAGASATAMYNTRIAPASSATITIGANNNLIGLLFAPGAQTVTEAGSGTHNLIAAVAIKPWTIANGVGATTYGASLYIENSIQGTAAITANYALWVDDGTVRLDGDFELQGIGTATASDVLYFNTATKKITYGAAPSGGGTTLNGTGYVKMSGTTVSYVASIPNADLTNSSITVQGTAVSLGSSVNVINGTGFVKASGTTISYDNSTYLTANQSITWTASGDISGSASGTTSISPSLTVTGLRSVALPTLGATAGLLKYTGTGTNTWVFDTATYLTANQSILFAASGDVSGSTSGTTNISPTLVLATINQGTGSSFVKISLDTKGRVTGNTAVAASDINTVFGSQTAKFFYAAPNGANGTPSFRAILASDIPTLNQDTSGSAGSVTNSLILKADSGTTEGTDQYTFNGSAAKTLNLVAGTNITITKAAGSWTIASTGGGGGGVTSISFGTTGLSPQTATTGAVTVSGTLAVGNGGTGATTATAAFDALSPMTTVGDLIYEGTGPSATRLAGNTTTTKQFLSQTGTGSASAAPAWATITLNDISTLSVSAPSNGQVLQYNGTNWVNATNSATIAIGSSITSATAGSVLFAGTSGVLAQSNAQLFWDNTNSRLGLGTATPANKLDVIRGTAGAMGRGTYESASFSFDGDMKFGLYTAAAAGAGGASLIFGATNFTASSNYPGFELQFVPSATLASNVMRFNYVNRNSTGTVVSSTADIFNIFQGGNVTVGTGTNGGFKLDVAGTTRIQNNTTISAGTLTVSALTVNGGVLYTTSTGVVSQNSALFYSTGLLTLGTGAASQQIKFNYNTAGGGDFTGQMAGTDQMSFGFNNTAIWGGTSGNANGRAIYFYDRVSAVNIVGASLAGFFIGPSSTNYTFWAERPNASVAAVKITAAGNLLVGTGTDSLAKVTTGGSITAATAIARGVYFNNTLVAAANSDVLVGLDVAPTFTNGAFTSVKNYGIRMSGQLNLSSYTTTTSYTGTVVGILGFDSSGNIITTTSSGGGGGITSLGGQTGATQTFQNDLNVTITSGTNNHQLGWSGTLAIGRGGTGATTATAAFDALNPMTTLGDIIYEAAGPTAARLAGNTTTTKQFLTQTGTGAVSAAPSWGTILGADVPLFTSTLQGTVPASGGGTTNFLRADGTWAAPAGGSGSPSGSTGNIQFNNAGAFGSNALFVFNNAAISMGIGTATVNNAAILQLSSTTKGFLPPTMTAQQRTAIASPPNGLIVYQTDGTAGPYVVVAGVWRAFTLAR